MFPIWANFRWLVEASADDCVLYTKKVERTGTKVEETQVQGYVSAAVEEYKEGLGWFVKHLPEAGEKYLAFSGACFQPGAISEKDKHLIALGISLQTQDEYCIMYHGTRAQDCGATREEILETLGVCAGFGGGAAIAQGGTLLKDVLDEYSAVQH